MGADFRNESSEKSRGVTLRRDRVRNGVIETRSYVILDVIDRVQLRSALVGSVE